MKENDRKKENESKSKKMKEHEQMNEHKKNNKIKENERKWKDDGNEKVLLFFILVENLKNSKQ